MSDMSPVWEGLRSRNTSPVAGVNGAKEAWTDQTISVQCQFAAGCVYHGRETCIGESPLYSFRTKIAQYHKRGPYREPPPYTCGPSRPFPAPMGPDILTPLATHPWPHRTNCCWCCGYHPCRQSDRFYPGPPFGLIRVSPL